MLLGDEIVNVREHECTCTHKILSNGTDIRNHQSIRIFYNYVTKVKMITGNGQAALENITILIIKNIMIIQIVYI